MRESKWDFSVIRSLIRKKAYFEDRDIDDQEVIDALGVSTSTFYRYLREDIYEPAHHVVKALCEYFEVSDSVFLKGTTASEEESPGNINAAPNLYVSLQGLRAEL